MTHVLLAVALLAWSVGLTLLARSLLRAGLTSKSSRNRPAPAAQAKSYRALRTAGHRLRLDAELPLMLDLLVLGLESGQGLTGAWQLACHHCPRGPLARSIEQVLAAWQAGQGRAQALTDWAQRESVASIRQLVALLNQSDRLGASLAPLLRRQADELRLRQQLDAETRALELPLRLLAPLLICILPCTFLILLFPIVQQLRQVL